MATTQKRVEAQQQQKEELTRKKKGLEFLEGFGDCGVEPLEPRTEETELPSATQFSSYFENFFQENKAIEHKFRLVAQKKLASVESVLTAFSKIPVEETSLFLFLELPKALLETIRGEETDFAVISRDFEGWKQRLADESRACCEMGRLTLREINEKVLQMTKRMSHLQISFTHLVGQRLIGSQERLPALERGDPETPEALKATIRNFENAGRIIREPVHRAGTQGQRNLGPQADIFGGHREKLGLNY